MPSDYYTARSVARAVMIAILVVLALYVMYLLRKPISWLIIAAFIAIAAAGPVNFFQRFMKRGLAIALTYLTIILIPVGLGALLLPPIVTEVEDLARNAPRYAQDVTDYVNENETLRNLNEDYDITGTIEEEAAKLPQRIPDAAGVLADIGVGFVNSVFAFVTILILSVFMVAAGPRWVEAFVESRNPDHSERIDRTLRRIANAVGNYVGGALLQATIAGVSAFVVLSVLGVPFAGPLAVLIFFFDLIPVIGATIGAVLVALVTVFVDFPLALIVWVVFAIVYQQVENYVIQPQIQKRATEIEPFIVLVAVLFGSTLFGILGAVLAIPTAASIQIAVQEWRRYRRELIAASPADVPPPGPPGPPAGPGGITPPTSPPGPPGGPPPPAPELGSA